MIMPKFAVTNTSVPKLLFLAVASRMTGDFSPL
jgi:hypothetical protein